VVGWNKAAEKFPDKTLQDITEDDFQTINGVGPVYAWNLSATVTALCDEGHANLELGETKAVLD
jgi:hypothetical protein